MPAENVYYQLSDVSREITYREWLKMGGNGMCMGDAQTAARNLGLRVRELDSCKLGEIEDAWPVATRSLARWALTEWNKPEWVVPVPMMISPRVFQPSSRADSQNK